MFTPRNTLVLVRAFFKPEERRGNLVVPTGQDEYVEGEVLEVGPGNVQASGGRSETFDLCPGQRVLVKHKTKMQGPNGQYRFRDDGLRLKDQDDKEGDLYLFEQNNILAVVAQPA